MTPGGCGNDLGRQFQISAVCSAQAPFRRSAGGTHLVAERDRPDLTVCGLAYEPGRSTRCVGGKQEFVELALREALSNAILHGNRLELRKLVHVRCCCEGAKGVFIVVRDQGNGFDPNTVPNPLAVENLEAEHGRGIHLMKLAMDEVSFERGGTEVRIRKQSGNEQKTPAHPGGNRTATY